MNEENLKPFKPGTSGNPAGKKRGTLSWKTTIKKWLDVEEDYLNPVTNKRERMTQYDIVILKVLSKARRGDIRAAEFLKDHMEAKAKQGLDITSAGENFFQKKIIFENYSNKNTKTS